MKSGFVNILKAPGYTSSDVVVIVRGVLSRHFDKKMKVGHLGTLDPAAAGVLPIAFGTATRLFDYYLKKSKEYRVSMKFGVETDTLDSCGKIIKASDKVPLENDIKACLKTFVGESMQTPPTYSAVSVQGVRAYKRARRDEAFEIKKRKIKIDRISNIVSKDNILNFDIICSSGTYIRSLVRDIAYKLDTVAYLSYLIRLSSGDFNIDNAVTLDEFRENTSDNLLNMEEYLSFMKNIRVNSDDLSKLINGGTIEMKNIKDKYSIISSEGQIIGIAENKDNILKLKTRL